MGGVRGRRGSASWSLNVCDRRATTVFFLRLLPLTTSIKVAEFVVAKLQIARDDDDDVSSTRGAHALDPGGKGVRGARRRFCPAFSATRLNRARHPHPPPYAPRTFKTLARILRAMQPRIRKMRLQTAATQQCTCFALQKLSFIAFDWVSQRGVILSHITQQNDAARKWGRQVYQHKHNMQPKAYQLAPVRAVAV
jgi:hypothetical protein